MSQETVSDLGSWVSVARSPKVSVTRAEAVPTGEEGAPRHGGTNGIITVNR